MLIMKETIYKWLFALCYLGSILLGNFFVIYFGILEFSISQNGHDLFKLVSPAGVIWVGLSFSFRDLSQRFWGKYKIWMWMLVATVITYEFNQDVALASIVSFLASETIDWIIFSTLHLPLKNRIVWSNLVAAPLDSFLFVYLAFGLNFEAIFGQAILKVLFSLAILPIVPHIDSLYNSLVKKDNN